MARLSWPSGPKMVLLLAGRNRLQRKADAELPLIVAHRGDRAHAPENTLRAFERALDAGAEMIEMDLQLAADGRVVVFHDFTLEALTEGSGPVAEQPSTRLAEWTVQGERFASAPDSGIPLLEEVLARIGTRCPLYLELKRAPHTTTNLAESVLELVPEDAPHVLASFDEELVSLCVDAGRRAALIANELAPALRFVDRIDGLHALSLRFGAWDEKGLEAAHARSLEAWAWTVNDRRDWWRLQRMGVDAICTDDPAAARQWCEEFS